MKKLVALAALALLFSPVAKAQYLLTIDLSDINNVVITATGENPIANSSDIDGGSAGFTLLSFFTANSTLFAFGGGDLTANGMTSAYQGASANDYAAGTGWGFEGLDLTILFGEGLQDFSTSSPAFTGSMTLEMTVVSGLLPAIGTTGDIRAGDGFLGNESQPAAVGPVIGQYRVVPEPASVLLVTAAGMALLLRRRR